MTATAQLPNQRVKPLFELPESIHRILFVEKLGEAVHNPARTASTYVVTAPIAEAFDRALRLVGAALADERSRAAYLHGSFGSGKSHFMAMLSLLLDGDEHAWRVPELHALRQKHSFVGKKKLLQLHFHMIGFHSIEEAIFLRYLRFVREVHPEATTPGLFADETLFGDARTLADEIGDMAFFAPMNASAEGQSEWGGLSAAPEAWDRARFERHASSTEPQEREVLFSALVKTRFKAYAEERRQLIDLDTGLGVIGRHAAALGYQGIVLFLDEMVLWLASRASDVGWFHNEVQKLVKLVESQDTRRELPFMSFIARQRDLAEMVGQNYVGLENKLVRDSLQWSEGRYETITIEDRNLPAIVEKRVLVPHDEAAKLTLDGAFEKLKRGAADPAWKTMLGLLDAADFRRVYPFSPALVAALVALSNALQRERTAIKLLTELLVEHIEDLKLGDVVGVGDLFDVLTGGEASAEGIMRARFEAAKHLYTYRLLPMLQSQHGTDTAERCQRLRDTHPARLGCSNCPVTVCRTDNRLLKTLIIAALVPEVSVLKDMTAAKLVQLNHGSLRLPIPGTEASVVAKRLRDWASQIGQLHVGMQPDPTVTIQLEGVDLAPILAQASEFDSEGARQRILRDLLFEAMGVDKILDLGKDHKLKDWRGTDRLGHIRFGNVRTMGPEQLRCGDDYEWRFVIDYPFDAVGFGPHDDEAVIDQFRETHGGSWTLVWLPSFFTKQMTDMLGDLARLEYILQQPQRFVSHLSVDNQNRAKQDLASLQNQKRSRVVAALEQAYGLVRARDTEIDESLSVDKHLHVLKPGASVQVVLAANLATALESYIPALLEARYPRHPRLRAKLTAQRVERMVAKFADIIDSEKKQIPADKALIEEMSGTLGELGLVRVTETSVHLVEDKTLQDIERKRLQAVSERPEVHEIRRYIDDSGKMGLQPEALDLVTRCYARWSARTFVSAGLPYDVAGRVLPEHVVLEKPDLPSQEAWSTALEMAGKVLGVSLAGKALHADNLKRFETAIKEKVNAGRVTATASLDKALGLRLAELGLGTDVDRKVTAQSAAQLMSMLHGRVGKGLVEALAGYEAKRSEAAVSKSLVATDAVLAMLNTNLVFGQFAQLRARGDSIPRGGPLLEDVRACLRQDESNEPAATRVRALADEAMELLREPDPLPDTLLAKRLLTRDDPKKVLAELRKAIDEAEAALTSAPKSVRLSGTLSITRTES